MLPGHLAGCRPGGSRQRPVVNPSPLRRAPGTAAHSAKTGSCRRKGRATRLPVAGGQCDPADNQHETSSSCPATGCRTCASTCRPLDAPPPGRPAAARRRGRRSGRQGRTDLAAWTGRRMAGVARNIPWTHRPAPQGRLVRRLTIIRWPAQISPSTMVSDGGARGIRSQLEGCP